jgi:DNA-binding NtrC family response regulator
MEEVTLLMLWLGFDSDFGLRISKFSRILSDMSIRILDVGQCGFDGPAISQLLHEKLHATVQSAATADQAKRELASGKFDLVLVNREFAADRGSGVELIQDLVDNGTTVPLMLVSDHEDAQRAAVAAGAVRGFGKSELQEPATFELIKKSAKHSR